MADAGIAFDIPTFLRALDVYAAATQKDFAEVLNRAARNIGYRTAHFTPAAARAAIRADLHKDPRLRFALTAIALKKRGIGMLKKTEFAIAVERFITRRSASARYLRAAFATAVQELGGKWNGPKFKGGASGFANPATPKRLAAEIVATLGQPDGSHAASAERILLVAMVKAVNYVAADMVGHAQRLMQQTARAHSG